MASKDGEILNKPEDKSSLNQPTKTTATPASTSSSTKGKTEVDILKTAAANKTNENAGEQAAKGKKREVGKKIEDKLFKGRAILEKELLEKSQRVSSLEVQLKELQEKLRAEQAKEKTTNELHDETKAELAKAQEGLKNFEDLRKKNSVLSEENYNLRERLVKRDEEIERLNDEAVKKAEQSAKNASSECESPLHKILRKENVELHYEKEQLKIERDRMRHTLKEKQDQLAKMSSSIGDLEDQLFHAKRSLDDRAKTSSRLEDRLVKMDGELNRYRERFTKLEKQNKRLSDLVINEKSNRNESNENKNTSENEKEISNKKHVTLLQNKEEKLLQERCDMEKQVNNLTGKIKILECQLHKCGPERRPTNERGSQTDLGPTGTTVTSKRQAKSAGSNANRQTAGDETTVRKCKGIVTSLGKFFEELVKNQDDPNGRTRGRRTAIAARRANELLHELSVSMEHLIAPKDCEGAGRVSGCAKGEPECSGRSKEGALWDKVSHEVAHHEFGFEHLSPTGCGKGTGDRTNKDKEVQRAEKGLNTLYHSDAGPAADIGKVVTKDNLTKDEASKLMEANRKQTETFVREIISKHHGEIKALLENVCQLSAISNIPLDLSDAEGKGANTEASLAMQELDTFKTRAAKVQSLIIKMHTLAENTRNDKESVHCQLQVLEDELRQKETLLQAKSQELRRRHCKSLEMEKSFQAQVEVLVEDRTRVSNENARLQDVCRQKDFQIVEKSKEVKTVQAEIAKREKAHQQNLAKMKAKVEEAWNQYTSVKTRAEKRTAEFNEAAEKLKVSQGYLLDLWQTLKTVDTVVDTENDEL